MASKTYYEKLQISSNATSEDIKKAYRKLALKHHPDKNGGYGHEEFQQLAEIYETLIDPQRRRVYDASLQPPSRHQGMASREESYLDIFEEMFRDDLFDLGAMNDFHDIFHKKTRRAFARAVNTPSFASSPSSTSRLFNEFFNNSASSSSRYTASSSSNTRSTPARTSHYQPSQQSVSQSHHTTSYGRFDKNGNLVWIYETNTL